MGLGLLGSALAGAVGSAAGGMAQSMAKEDEMKQQNDMLLDRSKKLADYGQELEETKRKSIQQKMSEAIEFVKQNNPNLSRKEMLQATSEELANRNLDNKSHLGLLENMRKDEATEATNNLRKSIEEMRQEGRADARAGRAAAATAKIEETQRYHDLKAVDAHDGRLKAMYQIEHKDADTGKVTYGPDVSVINKLQALRDDLGGDNPRNGISAANAVAAHLDQETIRRTPYPKLLELAVSMARGGKPGTKPAAEAPKPAPGSDEAMNIEATKSKARGDAMHKNRDGLINSIPQ